jgi:hypothetical protein
MDFEAAKSIIGGWTDSQSGDTKMDSAMISMLVCGGLESAEQAKVNRLDSGIAERFLRAGLNERVFCQGVGDGAQRVLNFRAQRGIVASVSARDFLASDEDAIAMLVRRLTSRRSHE